MSSRRTGALASGLLGRRDFRLLWLGEGVSVLGDQFYLVALPWLVLSTTGDGAAMAGVLASAALPRAVLMLAGGLITDRFSALRVMFVTAIARMLVVGVLGVLVIAGAAPLWSLHLCALAFGVADALYFPARAAVLPQLVAVSELPRANAVMTSTSRLSGVVGPALAGILIAGSGQQAGSTLGRGSLGSAFLIDAASFLISALCLWAMQATARAVPTASRVGALAAFREGLGVVARDPVLRVLIPFFSCMAFVAHGVVGVVLPVLADQRFGGAVAFGSLLSGMAGGALLGAVAVGLLPRPPAARLHALAMACFGCFGLGIGLLALAPTAAVATATLVAMNAFGTYAEVQVIAWVQARVSPSLLGRVMSLLMFSTLGLSPVAIASFGWLLPLGVGRILAAAGTLYVGFALASLASREVRGARSPAAARAQAGT